MNFTLSYTTPTGVSFSVNILAPNERDARLVWAHRHPVDFGYALTDVRVAEAGAIAHLHWDDYEDEFRECLSSRLVKGTEMGLIILILLGYIACIAGGTATGLYIAQSRNHAESMPMGLGGLFLGIICGYAANVLLDWMRSILLLLQSIITFQSRTISTPGEKDPTKND